MNFSLVACMNSRRPGVVPMGFYKCDTGGRPDAKWRAHNATVRGFEPLASEGALLRH